VHVTKPDLMVDCIPRNLVNNQTSQSLAGEE
jgi:hypothetical protein